MNPVARKTFAFPAVIAASLLAIVGGLPLLPDAKKELVAHFYGLPRAKSASVRVRPKRSTSRVSAWAS